MPFTDPALRPETPRRQPYRLADGTRVPSVTAVLGRVIAKPSLTRWANRLGMQGIDAEDVRDQRAAEGTVLHTYIEAHLRGNDPDLSPFSPSAKAGGLVAFLRWRRSWFDRHAVEPLEIERRMVSERRGYGGTPDLIARVDGRLELLDWKTSREVSTEHLVQVAAYAALAWEHGHRVVAVRVVRAGCDADGTYGEHVLTLAESMPYWRTFQAALALWRALEAAPDAAASAVQHTHVTGDVMERFDDPVEVA